MGGTRSQVGRTIAGGRGKSWPAKFATYAGSTIRIVGGSAHPHAIISGGSSHTPATNGASSPKKPKQCSSPRKPKQCSSSRKPKQWREWCEWGVHATVLSQALLAHQVPPPVYSGEGDGIYMGSFSEWHEQLKMVASMCQWSEQVKLVNIAGRLKGEAYAFYRSCTSTQRASYPLLVEQLSKRFTPVQIQSVQSTLFHDRKQRQGETADTFAQELRSLLRKAYPPAVRVSEEVETRGRAVLANQFLAGLHPELKGQEGTFDQLLARARFEEAKLRDFGRDSGRRSGVRSYGGESDHLANLRSILQRLQAAGLKLKAKKCSFMQAQVEYLGHIVSCQGVSVDPKKAAAIQEVPQPVNLKSLRSFLGLASYYRRFVPGFSHLADPCML